MDYKKYENGQERVLVHWVGYPTEDETWEPVWNLGSGFSDSLNILRQKWASDNEPEVLFRNFLHKKNSK